MNTLVEVRDIPKHVESEFQNLFKKDDLEGIFKRVSSIRRSENGQSILFCIRDKERANILHYIIRYLNNYPEDIEEVAIIVHFVHYLLMVPDNSFVFPLAHLKPNGLILLTRVIPFFVYFTQEQTRKKCLDVFEFNPAVAHKIEPSKFSKAVTYEDAVSNNLLHFLAVEGKTELIESMIENNKQMTDLLFRENNIGITPSAILLYLYTFNVNEIWYPQITESYLGHRYTIEDYDNIVTKVIESKEKTSNTDVDEYGNLVLHLAVLKSDISVFERLIEAGQSPYLTTSVGNALELSNKTAMSVLIFYNLRKCVKD